MNRTTPLVWILLALSTSVFAADGGQGAGVTVSVRPLQVQHRYFAQVEPQQDYVVSTSLAGRISDFAVRAGDPVRKGQLLARLSGPSVRAKMNAVQERVKRARSSLDTARTVYDIKKHEYSEQITTHIALITAHDSFVQAQSRLDAAQSRLQSLSERIQLKAPVSGKVSALFVADAGFVQAGQKLLSILPERGLWLASRIYGPDGQLVHVGQQGWFVADGSDRKIPVKVASVVSDPKIAGISHVYLTSDKNSSSLTAGQAGTVALSGPTRSLPAVPSAAVILDQGSWWIMVRQGEGWVPDQIHPVARHDGWTWLTSDFDAGQRVLVQGAYQAFHRDFAKHYANPD